jgi:hypothetical protein
MFFIEETVVSQPAQGSFNNPALGQHLKALDIIRAFDDFQPTLQAALHPGNQLSGIGAISPDELESSLEPTQEHLSPIPVLDICRMNQKTLQESQGIYKNMALPALDALASIEPASPPF